jgi:EAL domain-containing protein (putative c-di-GMP-specific phosphodiesterase class I)
VADPELPARVASELESAGAKGTGLWLEISETAAILNVDRARTLAARLASAGCELALDDFGAGFASFYYLKHLAFDYVKIDSEFIAQLRQNRTNELVVRAIVDITRGLGKLTIAECVNDLETVDLLRDLGVDYAQGYFLGEPRPLAEIDVLRAIAAPDRAATT